MTHKKYRRRNAQIHLFDAQPTEPVKTAPDPKVKRKKKANASRTDDDRRDSSSPE